jgi:hypothetical protein
MIFALSRILLYFEWDKIKTGDQDVFTHGKKLIAKNKDSGKLQWIRRLIAICTELEICIT